jgi:hypothetical protein
MDLTYRLYEYSQAERLSYHINGANPLMQHVCSHDLTSRGFVLACFPRLPTRRCLLPYPRKRSLFTSTTKFALP